MKIGRAEFAADNLGGTQWVGIIEDNADPLFEGRCKVRVHGKLDGRVDPSDPESAYSIPTENLPWARPGNGWSSGSETGTGTHEVPKVGSMVQMSFDNGDLYSPVYHYNLYPSDDLKTEMEASYENAHSIIYDTTTEGGVKIYFTEAKGLMLDYKETQINILPDNSVVIQNPNGDSIEMTNSGAITLNHSADVTINCVNAKISASGETHVDSPKIKLGTTAAEAVIKGDTFKGIFDAHIHPTGVGPSGPPTTSAGPSLSSKNSTD